MSLHKMFSVLCLASVIGSGCGVAPAVGEHDAVHAALRGDGWSNSNYNQLFSATLEGQTVTGLYFAGGAWFVSTGSSLTYAQVTSIAYNGQAIAPQNLTTAQGSFLVIGADAEDASVELVLTVAAPLAGTLRITAASTATDGSFSRYTTQWVSANADDATTSVGLCPKEVLVTKTTTQTVYETMIPIGGVRWNLSGSKVSDANAITLGCSQDAEVLRDRRPRHVKAERELVHADDAPFRLRAALEQAHQEAGRLLVLLVGQEATRSRERARMFAYERRAMTRVSLRARRCGRRRRSCRWG